MKRLHTITRIAAVVLTCGFAACSTQRSESRPTTARAPAAESVRVLGATERPGLGTAWGEPRESWVEPAYFARAWENRPSGAEKLFYNDKEGIDATVAYLGGEPKSAAGLQRAAGGLVRLGLRDGSGRWYDSLQLRDQRFTIGERGARYELVVKNETRKRLEVVLSVDGLDTLDGETASLKKRGYVLAPRETLSVEGFRVSDGSVSAFRFTNIGDTYAQRRYGQTGNVGVIGLAVFAERWLGTPPASKRPENRAWRHADPHEIPSSRRYATPPDA